MWSSIAPTRFLFSGSRCSDQLCGRLPTLIRSCGRGKQRKGKLRKNCKCHSLLKGHNSMNVKIAALNCERCNECHKIAPGCSFCWLCHVSSSHWSDIPKITSFQDRSLQVFSKCICLCYCLCHCILLVRSCLLITLTTCLKGHKTPNAYSSLNIHPAD